MEGPGYLAVAIQPGWNTDPEIFEDWYKTEHGPLRLRLPFITTGDRYAALDGRKPAWSAVYDVTELAHLESRIYTRLREERSQREMAVMGTFESLDRKIYSLISSRGESRGPAPVTRPGLAATNVQVISARTECLDASPVSQSSPLGKSTASTGASTALI